MVLTPEQNSAWRSLVLVTHVLDAALDRQSQRDGGLPHAYYTVLVFLFESPGRRLTMSELAAQQRYSTSRMTHAVTAMEKSGWVRRRVSPVDRRVRLVELTQQGVDLVRVVSPQQVIDVRQRVFANLDPAQVQQLEAISLAIVRGLDDE
jgi:DNA-binding MarR family transcriptional regulator